MAYTSFEYRDLAVDQATIAPGGTVTGILSGNQIVAPTPAPPTPEQSAITASLGISGDDISAILAFTTTANTLTLANVSKTSLVAADFTFA